MRRVGLRVGAVGLALLGAAWLGSYALGYDVVLDVHPERASAAPAVGLWLGADHLGRDVARRVLLGTQAFVGPGLGAVALALGLGGSSGALAGWWGGWAAAGLRYGMAVLASIPTLPGALLAGAVLAGAGGSVWRLAAVVGLCSAPAVSEAVYGRVQALRRADFVLGLQAHGLHPARVLAWHVLWVSCRGLLARQATRAFAALLTAETTLSYLGGFGVAEPQPSWGNMIAFEWQVSGGNPWAWAGPALALWAAAFSASQVAAGLAEGQDG